MSSELIHVVAGIRTPFLSSSGNSVMTHSDLHKRLRFYSGRLSSLWGTGASLEKSCGCPWSRRPSGGQKVTPMCHLQRGWQSSTTCLEISLGPERVGCEAGPSAHTLALAPLVCAGVTCCSPRVCTPPALLLCTQQLRDSRPQGWGAHHLTRETKLTYDNYTVQRRATKQVWGLAVSWGA